MSVGEHVSWTVLPGIEPEGKEMETIVQEAEDAVKAEVN